MPPSLSGLPEKLESQRLLIRKYSKTDGKALFELLERNNNREFLFPNVEEVANIKTVKDAETKAQRHEVEWETRKRFVLCILEKTTNTYIGEIWIEPHKWEVPAFELGWFLGQGYQGQGFATEAARRSLEFLFHDLYVFLYSFSTNFFMDFYVSICIFFLFFELNIYI